MRPAECFSHHILNSHPKYFSSALPQRRSVSVGSISHSNTGMLTFHVGTNGKSIQPTQSGSISHSNTGMLTFHVGTFLSSTGSSERATALSFNAGPGTEMRGKSGSRIGLPWGIVTRRFNSECLCVSATIDLLLNISLINSKRINAHVQFVNMNKRTELDGARCRFLYPLT